MPGEDTVKLPMYPEELSPYWHGLVPWLKVEVVDHWNGWFAEQRNPEFCRSITKSPMLTEEEERLLVAFRQFKAMLLKPEGVFRWKTQQEPGVIPAPERFLIVDPKEDWNCR